MLLLGSAALAARLHRSPPQPAMPAEVQHPAPPESRRAVAQTALAAGARDADAAATGTGHPAAGGQNALVLPPEAVKAGSTRFLNGKWRATVALKDPITGKRPGLQYRLNGGKGNAIIAYGDGVSCRVAVEAGLMQSGNLRDQQPHQGALQRRQPLPDPGDRLPPGRNRRGGVHRPLRCGHHLSHDVQARE